jgi:hypothetical protein
MMIGSVVMDVRDMVERGVFTDEEMDTVVTFHDLSEEFWRHTLVSNPPMQPLLLVAGLRQLRDSCVGPVAGFQPRLDQVLEKATIFAASGEHGRR